MKQTCWLVMRCNRTDMRYLISLLFCLCMSIQAAPFGPAQVASWSPSLLNGLVAYWPLDEASGTRYDAWTNALHLTDVNSLQSLSGKISRGSSNPVNSYLEIANTNLLNFTNAVFSFNCWAYFTATNAPITLASFYTAWTQKAWWIYYENGSMYGSMIFDTSTDGANNFIPYDLTNKITVVLNEWAMWTFVLNRENRYIYKNGELVTSFNFPASVKIHQSTSKAYLGFINGYSTSMVKLMDEVGIWNRVLTPSEITTLYNIGRGRRFPFNSGP